LGRWRGKQDFLKGMWFLSFSFLAVELEERGLED
jgi:hypothetical protein